MVSGGGLRVRHSSPSWHAGSEERSDACCWARRRSIEIPPDITSFSVAVTCECGTRFCTGCRKLPHEPAPCKAWEAFDEELKMFEHNNEVLCLARKCCAGTRCGVRG